ncbi:TolC family protein [Aliidiomarina sp. Khilg15.8]
MSFTTRAVRLLTVVATLSLAACASYSPDYEALNQPVRVDAQPLPVDADMAELIRYAQRNHPAVLAAEAQVERARAAATSAGAFADPQVNFSQGLNDADYQTLGVSQEIPIFSRRGMSIEQARTAERAALARLDEVKANLAATLVEAFSEYLYVQENLGLQSDLIQLLEQFVAVAEQGYAAGSVGMADLLRAQNALDEARSDYQNLQTMLVSQRARLNSNLGRDARAELGGEYSLIESHRHFASLPAQPDDLYEQLGKQNPALLASRFEVESMLVGKDIADTAGLPRLMVGAEYMNTAMASDTVAGMLSVSLPIWRSNYRAQREAADASVQAGMQQLRATELEVQAELSMTLYKWREAERNRQLYGEVLTTRAEQAVASTLSSYQNGNARFTDVITSQREWLSFALAYRRALANQLAAVASIHALIPSVTAIEVNHE